MTCFYCKQQRSPTLTAYFIGAISILAIKLTMDCVSTRTPTPMVLDTATFLR